jgi:hypothetical protein
MINANSGCMNKREALSKGILEYKALFKGVDEN